MAVPYLTQTQGTNPMLLYLAMMSAANKPTVDPAAEVVKKGLGLGAAGGAASLPLVGTGAESATTAALSGLGTGPTVQAASLPAASATPAATSGFSAFAIPAAVAALYGNNIYESGGKEILAGKGKTKDWTDTALNVNPMTAPFNMASRFLTGNSLGSHLFKSEKFKTEGKKLNDLRSRGINIPDSLMDPASLEKGRSREELAKIEQDKINQGQYGNVDFAKTRDKKYLKPQDIWGYGAFFDKFGNDWLGKFDESQRTQIAQKALDRGAVNEGKGSISVNWSPDLENDIAGILKPQAPTAPQSQNNKIPSLIGRGLPTNTQPSLGSGIDSGRYQQTSNANEMLRNIEQAAKKYGPINVMNKTPGTGVAATSIGNSKLRKLY